MIANRMIPALEQIISQDQTGFLPGRRITKNIRRILDITIETQKDNKECVILNCDFLKCFDRIEKASIIGAMKMFKFSERLVKWVDIIYTDFSIKIQNNGKFSGKIDVTRSIRQGGPASNPIFIVVAELLATMD